MKSVTIDSARNESRQNEDAARFGGIAVAA